MWAMAGGKRTNNVWSIASAKNTKLTEIFVVLRVFVVKKIRVICEICGKKIILCVLCG